MKMKTFRSTVLLGVAALALMPGMNAADTPKTLYERLGGQPAVRAVASQLVDRILADARVNKWFAHAATSPANTEAYKAKLADFICQGTGGPCKYTGADMFAAHQGRGVTDEAFSAVVSDLVATLEKFKVPEKEKGQLLGILGPMKTAIVREQK